MAGLQPHRSLQKSFEFDLVEDFVGYVSSKDKTSLDKRMLIRGSQNVYLKLSGTVAVRPGLRTRGAADTTSAGTKSSFEWSTSLATTRNMRYNNGKLQVESDIVTPGTYLWYTILDSLTATAIAFETWWDDSAKKDILLFVLGDSSMRKWSGAMAKILSTTMTTIVLDRDATVAGFGASGTVLVNGTSYTYTSISGSTLNVSSNPTGEAVGSVVIDGVVVTATTPASNFNSDMIRVVGNQVAVGSTTSRLVYISKNNSYTDYTQSTPRLTGEGATLTLDDFPTGLALRQGKFHFSAGLADWYVINFTQITVGSTLSEQVTVSKQHTSDLGAALGHEFIDTFGDSLIYLDQNNQLRLFGDVRNFNQPQFPILSLPVQDELQEVDFTGGHLRAIGDTIYITAPLSGTDYMYQIRQDINKLGNITTNRIWHPPQIRNVSRFALIDGVLFGHSNGNPMIYQIWNTLQWHDDGPSGEPIPYNCNMRMAYRNHGRRQGLINFDKQYFEGYMTQGSAVYFRTYMDYQGSGDLLGGFINDPENALARKHATFFTGLSPDSLGDASLGDNPLGDTLTADSTVVTDQEMLPKFRKIVDVSPTDVFEYSLEVFSQDLDSRWEILCLGTNTQKSLNQAVQLRG